jgi:hypothetical protein
MESDILQALQLEQGFVDLFQSKEGIIVLIYLYGKRFSMGRQIPRAFESFY